MVMSFKDNLYYGVMSLSFLFYSCSRNKIDVMQDFLEYAKENDVENFRECFTEKRLNSVRGPSLSIVVNKLHFENCEIYELIPYEYKEYEKDLENVLWVEHPNGKCHEFRLVNENGWKIDYFGFCLDPRAKEENNF